MIKTPRKPILSNLINPQLLDMYYMRGYLYFMLSTTI